MHGLTRIRKAESSRKNQCSARRANRSVSPSLARTSRTSCSFASAHDPSANRLFLDFNLVANGAYFAIMLAMALTMPDEHQHIAGVLALGVITTVPLAACWLPVRRIRS